MSTWINGTSDLAMHLGIISGSSSSRIPASRSTRSTQKVGKSQTMLPRSLGPRWPRLRKSMSCRQSSRLRRHILTNSQLGWSDHRDSARATIPPPVWRCCRRESGHRPISCGTVGLGPQLVAGASIAGRNLSRTFGPGESSRRRKNDGTEALCIVSRKRLW